MRDAGYLCALVWRKNLESERTNRLLKAVISTAKEIAPED